MRGDGTGMSEIETREEKLEGGVEMKSTENIGYKRFISLINLSVEFDGKLVQCLARRF